VVSYATQAKIDVLEIDENLIAKHGVVSAEVAKEMAKSVQKVMNSDCAIATTGNAGPTKGDEDAELGTVFIGIAMYNEVFVEEFNFGQPREKVIDRAVSKGLELIYKEILKK
jgi:nicotinamide-nucleotide amidase